MYLLTRLSASQTATWHVYFRIHHKYKSILNYQRVARGAAVEERKEPQHVARRTLKTAWCGPERSILDLLHTVQKRHTKPVWLACWRPQWRPRGSSVEVARAMRSSIPVNCPWGSACSCRMAPAHFWLPRPGVEPPHTCSPSSPTQAPSEGSSVLP